MSPKEKARELLKLFTTVGLQQRNEGKACALICASEVQKNCAFYDYRVKRDDMETYQLGDVYFATYWEEVQAEIEAL